MNYKARNLTKGFVTHVTFERFLSSIISLMTSKVCILSKAPATNITFIWFLSSMNSLMNCKVCILTKGFATYITFIWFFSNMNSPMNHKIKLVTEVLCHINYIYMISFLYELFDAWLELNVCWNLGHTHYICKFSLVWILWRIPRLAFWVKHWPHTSHLYVSLQHEFSDELEGLQSDYRPCDICHIYMVSLQYEFSDELQAWHLD